MVTHEHTQKINFCHEIWHRIQALFHHTCRGGLGRNFYFMRKFKELIRQLLNSLWKGGGEQ